MDQYAEIGNTVIMTKELLKTIVEASAKVGCNAGIDMYRRLKLEEKKMSASEVAKLEGVSPTAVINWINNGRGHKNIKLKATQKGTRNYVITGLDFEEFKEKLR